MESKNGKSERLTSVVATKVTPTEKRLFAEWAKAQGQTESGANRSLIQDAIREAA
jgi:hypothetical protein